PRQLRRLESSRSPRRHSEHTGADWPARSPTAYAPLTGTRQRELLSRAAAPGWRQRVLLGDDDAAGGRWTSKSGHLSDKPHTTTLRRRTRNTRYFLLHTCSSNRVVRVLEQTTCLCFNEH